MTRPNPDALLAQLYTDESLQQQGKLRLYLGASAGVGKTCAMLTAAHAEYNRGCNLVIGVIETHGRNETAVLTEGLPSLPLRSLNYRGTELHEFDLDEALRRHPTLILMDELAHSNAEGSRHPKRWQDVKELLAAGIDVWSTLNIQHLESLSDAVNTITGIQIFESVPDTILDQANEVILVDVPVDELLERLRVGKIYPLAHAERASQNFFRKGNLIALREMALRRTADRIESDVKSYRIEKSISKIWKTEAALLACIGPELCAEQVVRHASRLAIELGVRWHAVYVETPRLQRLPRGERNRILGVLKHAEELGAQTAILAAENIPARIAEYASAHNLSKIVIGAPDPQPTLWKFLIGNRWLSNFHMKLAKHISDIDIIYTSTSSPLDRSSKDSRLTLEELEQHAETPLQFIQRYHAYFWVIMVSAAITLLATPLSRVLDLTNIIMLFLLTVVWSALQFGRKPAAFAAFLSVASFDFFFVPPRFSFAVTDFQYLLTFAVMLAVGLLIGQLTASLRFQARIATHREERALSLFEFARDLSGSLQKERVVNMSLHTLEKTFDADVALITPDEAEHLQTFSFASTSVMIDQTLAQWAFEKGEMAGNATNTLPLSIYRYLPLKAPVRIRGVLAIKPRQNRWLFTPEQQRHLDTFASLIAIALERVHYVEVAQNALLRMESERLRNSLLAAISHDIRTPLTVLSGLAETLLNTPPLLSSTQQELAESIQGESSRMKMLVTNLLDMARLQNGELGPKREWQPIEEVIGTSIHALNTILKHRTITVNLASDLPLIEIDALLIERVFVNLLENASKYTPSDSSIYIEANTTPNGYMQIDIIDRGEGLPAGWEESIFDKFTRIHAESPIPGVGLGLAICRAIVESHGGKIWGINHPEGGACFSFTLPLGTPPEINELL
ncbi:MAG: DUF4118 domain-containing protein [Pseudomonadota bacterium]